MISKEIPKIQEESQGYNNISQGYSVNTREKEGILGI
jgi:hypothetical protein